jgi:phosphoesterase RecJ-like protein
VSDAFMSAEDLVTYPRSLDGVKVGMLLREEGPGVVKVSLRAKGEVPVNRIAGRFGGGGHENAAGCTVPGSLDEVAGQMLAAIRDALPARSR